MRASRFVGVGAALALAAALSVVPLQVAGALSPSTSVLVPSSGATLSGSTVLDAAASNATSVEFLLFGGTYGYSAPVVCTATRTYYGWLCRRDTRTVPNGTYALVSEASGADGNAFSKVTITVDNAPPSTSVIIPASGATMDTAKTVVFDALASPGVATVSFVSTVNGITDTNTASPTIYGWIYVVSTGGPPCSGCIAYSFPISIQSVASYAGGVSGTSAPVNATLILYLPNDIA
jgi:hypothetical protein